MKKIIFFPVALIFLALVAYGATNVWNFDKAHSSIKFIAQHMKISEVAGEFKKYSGTIKTEGKDFEDAKIEVRIDVNSINTGIKKRDNHLRSEDFFYAEKYPEIIFKSTSLKKIKDDKYELKGKLTMLGKTQTETFDAVYNGTIKDPYGYNRSGWKITGSVNRFDYGLKWNKTLETGGLIVGKKINILCDIELVTK